MKIRYILYVLLIIVPLFVIFEWTGIINFKADTMYHSTTTTGLVTNKKVDEKFNYYVYFNVVDETNEGIKEVKVIVPSENLWKLIEVDRTYFVAYQWKNNETPLLNQIEINNEFKEIYPDKLIPKDK